MPRFSAIGEVRQDIKTLIEKVGGLTVAVDSISKSCDDKHARLKAEIKQNGSAAKLAEVLAESEAKPKKGIAKLFETIKGAGNTAVTAAKVAFYAGGAIVIFGIIITTFLSQNAIKELREAQNKNSTNQIETSERNLKAINDLKTELLIMENKIAKFNNRVYNGSANP